MRCSADLSWVLTSESGRPGYFTKAGLGGSLCALADEGAIAAVDLLERPENLTASGPRQDTCELLRRAGRDVGVDVTEDTERPVVLPA